MNAYDNDSELTLSYNAPLEMAPEGRHPMLCVDVFETWPEEETWNNETSTKRKIMFVFQVFPEGGSRDSCGDIYRVEYKVNFSFSPAGLNMNASRLWTTLETWRGESFSIKKAQFNPVSMKGKAAWGTLEHKTRYVQITAIEPYVDDDGKPLPAPKAESYSRRTYPNPETWKSKKTAQAQTARSITSPGGQQNAADPNEDFIPF